MSDHPSYLELDEFVLGQQSEGPLRDHVASCARCRSHVERAHSSGPTPPWVRELPPRRSAPHRSWLWAGGSVAAAALVLLLFVVRRDEVPPSESDTAAKGGAEVAVYVKRGDAVSLWNGASRIRPGDAIRLELAPAGYQHLAVFSEVGERYLELYRAPVPPGGKPVLLPKAWSVDDAPGPEVLVVVLSRAPLPRTGLRPHHFDPDARPPRWVARLVLEKDLEEDTP